MDIWKVSLSLQGDAVNQLEKLLLLEELKKGNRFRFAKDRRRHIITRGAVRTILAGYLEVPPQDLLFHHGKMGKPHLVYPLWGRNLHFNLSHCEDMTVIAIALGRRLGIDVEKERELPELDTILGRYFSKEEQQFVESAGQEDRIKAFLKVWTRREATAKALGLDLSAALSDLEIPAHLPNRGIQLRHFANIETSSTTWDKSWHLVDLQLDSVHGGAICVEGPRCAMRYHHFEDCFVGSAWKVG